MPPSRGFLTEHCDDADLLAMVQYHDVPFALWRQFEAKGHYHADRFATLLATIKGWNFFLTFQIVDGCTEGKSREPLRWYFQEVRGKVGSSFTPDDILQPVHNVI